MKDRKKLMQFMRPSNSNRWLKCPASLTYETVNSHNNEAALLGGFLHSLCADYFINSLTLYGKANITPESQFFVLKSYIQFVKNKIESGAEELHFEKKLNIRIHIKDDFYFNFTGTPDLFFINQKHSNLSILDLKTGIEPVESYDNFQMLSYAVLVIDNRIFRPSLTKHISLVILQPKSLKGVALNSYTVPLEEVQSFRKMLISKIKNIFDTTKPLSYFEGSHCKHCPGFLKCPEKNTKINTLSLESDKDLDNLVNILKRKETILAFIKKAEQKVLEKIEQGFSFPGIERTPVFSRKRIADIKAFIDQLAKNVPAFNPFVSFTKNLKSVSILKKELKGEIDNWDDLLIQDQKNFKITVNNIEVNHERK